MFKNKSFRALWLAPLISLITGCTGLLYYPTPYEYPDRKTMAQQPEDINFPSQDETKLHAWRFKSRLKTSSKCVLLHFHGNAQNLTTHFANFYSLPSVGYDYFIFDYRGYGSSQGKPTPEGTVLDGHAALRWIHKEYPDKDIVVIGQSLGGAIAMRTVLDLKDEVPVRLLVLDSTFSSYRSAARKVLAKNWVTWLLQPLGWLLMNDEYAPGDLSKLSPTPLVIIHGDRDQTIDFSLGERIFNEASEPKEFWRIPGGRHTDFMWRENGKYAEQFYNKLENVCGHVPDNKSSKEGGTARRSDEFLKATDRKAI